MSNDDSLRHYWDSEAETYDSSPEHNMASAAERAAWTSILSRLLPSQGRVLDVGSGTGFVALAAARLGLQVTAADISSGMLQRLQAAADKERLSIEVVQGTADKPPLGPFDAVVARSVMWTLPDPEAALAAWRTAAPTGRLVILEGLWVWTGTPDAIRRRARDWLQHRYGVPHGASRWLR